MGYVYFALDVDSEERARPLLEMLAPHIGIKIGHELAEAMGSGHAIALAQEYGAQNIFRDGKFIDIPPSVAGAIKKVAMRRVTVVNVMALGGRAMMVAARKAAEEVAQETGERTKVIAVTILTSLNQGDLEELNFTRIDLTMHAASLAKLAQDCELDGVVASPLEAPMIREVCGPNFDITTPGITPAWALWAIRADQKRTTTHIEAKTFGASNIVVGRAISAAPNPVEAALRISEEFDAA